MGGGGARGGTNVQRPNMGGGGIKDMPPRVFPTYYYRKPFIISVEPAFYFCLVCESLEKQRSTATIAYLPIQH